MMPRAQQSLTPLERAVSIFGSQREVARICGRNQAGVSRLMQARRNRAAGELPMHHIRMLLAEAKRRGIPLTMADLMVADAAEAIPAS